MTVEFTAGPSHVVGGSSVTPPLFGSLYSAYRYFTFRIKFRTAFEKPSKSRYGNIISSGRTLGGKKIKIKINNHYITENEYRRVYIYRETHMCSVLLIRAMLFRQDIKGVSKIYGFSIFQRVYTCVHFENYQHYAR